MEQYSEIQQLLKKEPGQTERKPIYPSTVIQSVFDARTGASLEAILAQFNAIYVQYQGTPEATRNIIPEVMRRAGLTITYMDMESNTITERASSAVQKDNNHWGLDVNWSRVDELSLSGEISVSANGTWIINGEDTGIKAVGPKGDTGLTPWLKTIDNKLHFTYDNVTWEPCSDHIAHYFRIEGNKLQISADKETWETISDYIAAYFRFQASQSDSQGTSVGKIQISRDGSTWIDLSPEFTNNLRISGYVATTGALPPGSPVGTIYGVGPTYATEDTAKTNPIYRLYAYNGTTWVDNGQFTSISAGVVQETGTSETEVMSQKAVTEKLSELGSEIYNISFINLAQWGTGLSESLPEGEWGYNTTNKKVYYKRNGALESMEMDSNIVYKFGDEFFKWDGESLLTWDISTIRGLLINNDGMSWDDYPSLGGTVNTSSIGSPTEGSHKVIKVKAGQKIAVKGSPNGSNYYVFVKSIDLFEPTFDLVDSITGRVTISANASKTIDVPTDANYFVICHYYGSSDRSPQVLSIDGFDLIKGAKSYISDFSASLGEPSKKIVDFADTLTMGYYNTNNGVGGVAQLMGSDTLGTVLVRIKEGDVIDTNCELVSSGVRQWCIMKDDLTIVRVMPKFSQFVVGSSDIEKGGTVLAIPCRVTEQVEPLSVTRTRIVGGNKYGNKTVVLLGDSQIGQCQGVEDVIEGEIGNTVINAGFGGCRWSWRTTSGTSDWDKFCAIGITDAIIAKDFEPLYEAVDRLVEGGSGVNYFKRALDGLSSLEFGNGENIILVIAYGGNDHSSSAPLGGADSTDKETLYGAMNYVIDSLVKAYPMIDIRVLCPTYVAYTYEKDESGIKVVTEDSDVRKIGEYTRQQYAGLLLEHAKRKKMPTYDMYNRGGRNKDNIYILTADGIHPKTQLGVVHTANKYLRILSSF